MRPEALALARAVAVLEVDADLGAAATLAEIDVAAAQIAADALVAAQVFAPERPLRFAHPILRQAVYSDLPHGVALERAHARGSRARALTGPTRTASSSISWHPIPPGTRPRSSACCAAAERALARGAPDAATSLLERALAEPPDADRRGPLLFELGHAERWAGRLDAAAGHLREALTCTGAAQVREAISRELATALTTAASPEEGRGRPRAGGGRMSRRTNPSAAFASKATSRSSGSAHDDLTRRSAARAERVAAGLTGATPAERVLLGALAYWRGTSVTGTAERDGRRSPSGRWRVGGCSRSRRRTASTTCGRSSCCSGPTATRRPQRYWTQGMDDARASGSGTALVNHSIAFGRLHMFRGEVAEAEAAARLVEQVAPHIHYPYGAYAAATNLMLPLVERGELDEAESVLGRYGLTEGLPPPLATGQTMLYGRIVLRTAQGRYAEAAADAVELLQRHAVRGYAGLPHGAAIVRALLHAGDGERAREVAEEQLRIAERWRAPSFLGIAQRSLGLVADGGRGPRAAEGIGGDARAHSLPAGARPYPPRARRGAPAAEPASRGSRPAAARPRPGERLPRRTSWRAEAQDQLRACGARPRRLVLSGVESLTPTERRVARLVADGLSNPEVAQTMFVTRATVETHLGVRLSQARHLLAREAAGGARREISGRLPDAKRRASHDDGRHADHRDSRDDHERRAGSGRLGFATLCEAFEADRGRPSRPTRPADAGRRRGPDLGRLRRSRRTASPPAWPRSASVAGTPSRSCSASVSRRRASTPPRCSSAS